MDESTFLNEIAKRLRALREANCLTQAELAARCGVTAQSISNLECGRNSVSISHLCTLAEALKVPVEAFLTPSDYGAEFLALKSIFDRLPANDRKTAVRILSVIEQANDRPGYEDQAGSAPTT